jgi:hypothetical protein
MISPILKLVIFLILITTLTLAVFYIFTKNKKYLKLIKKIVNYSVYIGIVIITSYFLLKMTLIK